MAIVIGDIHGNVEKVKAFLAYKPDELHIALGDYLDSFNEPQVRQLEALQLLLDSPAILLWGNHDLHYCDNAPWICTGYDYDHWEPCSDLINSHKARFLAAYAVDGWLLTHAGCHVRMARHQNDVIAIAERFNNSIREWLEDGKWRSMFQIGKSRGGDEKNGGIFWFDFKRENGLADVKQIFGHTEVKEPVVTDRFVALDTTNNKADCWLFDTCVNEIVRLDLHANNQPAKISDLPEAEQGPFSRYLINKSTPFAGGYWPTDYRRWKPSWEKLMHNRLRNLPAEEQGPFWEWMMGQTRPFVEGIPQEDQDFFYEHDYQRWKRHPHSWEHDE